MAKKGSSIAIPANEEWRVESDLSTLLEAKKIEADPKRMERVKALAKKRMMDVASIAADKG